MELTTLADARAYLDGFLNLEKVQTFAYERLGLERIRRLLASVGNPQLDLPCIHIAGSKGKGSTALLTEALLRATDARVGTYTSPHLECWSERFRIDGAPVDEASLLRALRILQPAAEKQRLDPLECPSFFDVSTALALLVFRERGADVGVIEVGLGGRIDSTNVVDSRVSVLTSVQLEHTDKLGDTLEAIAWEKAGIFRTGVPALHGPLAPEALGVVLAHAAALDTPVEDVAASVTAVDARGQCIALQDGRTLRTNVLGRHQANNVALAIRAAERFTGDRLGTGPLSVLENARLPARLEIFGERIVLDCAHTPDSVRALRTSLSERSPGARWTLVTSISRDKDAASMLQELAPCVRACITCTSEPIRSIPAEELEALAWACGIEEVEALDSPRSALERALAIARGDEWVVVTGSIYLAGALRRPLREAFAVAGD